MNLPPLNTLRAFQLTARLSSVSRASEELNITHAAVSNQLKRLETWFGQKLFQRAGRGLVLTPAGEILQKTIDDAFAAIAETSQALRLSRDKKSISVACLASIATRWLVPALADFQDKFPNVAIRLSYAKAFEVFDAARHDVLITHLKGTAETAARIKLFSRANKPVASRAYIAKRRHFLEGTLEGARLLHDETTEAWDAWFEVSGNRPKKFTNGPVFDDFNLLSTAVLAGQGVALCPVEVFQREISEGKLLVLSETVTQAQDAYYIVSSDMRNPAVLSFKKWFVKTCAPVGPIG